MAHIKNCISYYFSNGTFGGYDYYKNDDDAEKAFFQRTHNGNFKHVQLHVFDESKGRYVLTKQDPRG